MSTRSKELAAAEYATRHATGDKESRGEEAWRRSILVAGEIPKDISDEMVEVGKRLSPRKSVTNIGRGLVFVVAGIIAFGLSSRLYIESQKLPIYFWPIFGITIGFWAGALVSLYNGRRLFKEERGWIDQLAKLRKRAGLD